MRKPESKISIFLGTLFFVSFIVICLVGIWLQHMYDVGMSVDFFKVIPAAMGLIGIVSLALTWMTWKITKGKL